jgi:hypothetical protein
MIKSVWSGVGPWWVFLALAGQAAVDAWGAPPDEDAPLIVRLVHPDRQAAEVLRLFEGSRAPSPAAALTAWKRATSYPGQFGKPLEAVIALSNPDMMREWRVFHDAELHLDLDPADGSTRWFAIVPRDDGTVAAAITSSRLTYPDEEPLVEDGRPLPVARLGRSGVPVACQVGPTLILGRSRTQLLEGVHRLRLDPRPAGREPVRPIRQGAGPGAPVAGVAGPLDSGLLFRLTPGRITTPRGGSLGLRRGVEFLHGIGCRRLEASVALQDGRLALEATTMFDTDRPPPRAGWKPAVVDPAWLEGLPSSDAIAVVSLAIDPDAAFWDWTFALIERVERTDPARVGLAPLRTRLNLLAAAAGVKPETDLWPHLRGVSACILGNAEKLGQASGAWLMLHLDEESNAAHLVHEFDLRLGSLLSARPKSEEARPDRPAGGTGAGAPLTVPRRLGTVLGREVTIWRRDRSVFVVWADDERVASLKTEVRSGRSIAVVCGGWAGQGRGAPQRVGAFWPGRIWHPRSGLEPSPAARHALADDPPVVWWGWSDQARAQDSLRWPGLPDRVRRFLEAVPLDPPRIP